MSEEDHGRGARSSPAVTPDELERERLQTYIEWARVEVPAWWLASYGFFVAAWVASHDLGGWWRGGATVVFVIAMIVLLRAVIKRSGVSTPRFRGMPSALQRTYLAPGLTAAAGVAAWIVLAVVLDDVPYTLLGVIVGPALSVSLAWQGRRCRLVAAQLAAEEGMVL